MKAVVELQYNGSTVQSNSRKYEIEENTEREIVKWPQTNYDDPLFFQFLLYID